MTGTAPNPSPDASPRERRERTRFALKLAVSIRLPGQRRTPARLLDISAGGGRILSTVALAPGASLWLQIAGLDPRYGYIAWAHDRFAGVRFAVPLDEAVVERLVADHGDVTERDTVELSALSRRCAELAPGAGSAAGAALDALARDCTTTIAEFTQAAERERRAALEARTRAILDRLSIPQSAPEG